MIVEIMGKHSNIIFCTPEGTILDSIKHISLQTSSVRGGSARPALFHPPHPGQGGPSDDYRRSFLCLGMSETHAHRQGPVHDPHRHQPSDRRRALPPLRHRIRPERQYPLPAGAFSSVSHLRAADGGCKRRPLRAEYHLSRRGACGGFPAWSLPSTRI